MKTVALSIDFLAKLEKELCDIGMKLITYTDRQVANGMPPAEVMEGQVFQSLQILNNAVTQLRSETTAALAADMLKRMTKVTEDVDFEFENDEIIEVYKPKGRYH